MNTKLPLYGMNAFTHLCKGTLTLEGRPIIFLDFDDVLCLNQPYGGYDVFQPVSEQPKDLYQRLWSPEAIQVLQRVVTSFNAKIVLTTSWLRLGDRDTFRTIFLASNLEWLDQALHTQWEAPQLRMESRWEAISRWIARFYQREPLVVLDDYYSGTGLQMSKLYRTGRIFLCEVGQGLQEQHWPRLASMLRSTK